MEEYICVYNCQNSVTLFEMLRLFYHSDYTEEQKETKIIKKKNMFYLLFRKVG